MATDTAWMTLPVVTLNQVPKRKARSTKILVSAIAQLGVHYNSIALYNIVSNMQNKTQGSGLQFFTAIDSI